MSQYDALLFVHEIVWRHFPEDCYILNHLLQAEVLVAKHFNKICNPYG